jgi:8-oxo-dGTP diphosphatase
MQIVDERAYPTRPFLAASAAVIRNGRVLIVRRGGTFGRGIYTLPGGVVEVGETLTDAVIREVREETQVAIEPVALAGYREMIMRDDDGKTARHFVIVCFAARWIAGEPVPDMTEIAEAAWRLPEELDGLKTTEGLREIIADAMGKL